MKAIPSWRAAGAVVGYRDPVSIAEMPYGAVVGTAFAPLVVGLIFIAVAARQGRRRRH